MIVTRINKSPNKLQMAAGHILGKQNKDMNRSIEKLQRFQTSSVKHRQNQRNSGVMKSSQYNHQQSVTNADTMSFNSGYLSSMMSVQAFKPLGPHLAQAR